MKELIAKLKRLFEPRPRPTESVGEATADRPPPPAEASPHAGPAQAEPTHAEPPRPEASPVEGTPARVPASLALDDLAEVRAALDAVAEAPVTTHEPQVEAEPSADEPEAAIEEAVEASSPESGRVGDALVLTLGTPPTKFTVMKASATLGRGQENSIRLDDLSVSRRHARIAYRQGGYWLSDLGSMGGTWVEGMRLNAPRRIAFGEVIDIGLCRLTVSFAAGAAKSPTTKSASKPPREMAAQVKRRR